jgi:hypothetical protein
MAQKISGVITGLQTMLQTVAVTVGGATFDLDNKVFKYLPSPNDLRAGDVFGTIFWSFPDQAQSLSQSVHAYELEFQVFAYDTRTDHILEVLAEVWDAIVEAWVADQRLGGTIIAGEIRGASPTLGTLSFNGQDYYAVSGFIDCQIDRAAA